MIAGLRRIWRAAPVATVLLGVAGLALIFFTVRLVAFWVYWSDPAHRDQALEGWMTPRYVATSWDVPPEVVGNALGLNREAPRRVTMEDLAAERGVTLGALEEQLATAIEAFRAGAPDRP